MDSNGMYSNMGSGMLGLEMSLHHVPPQQNPHPMQHQSHPPMVSYITHEVDHRQQSQPPLRPGGGGTYPSGNKPKTTPGLTLSDEDDPGGPTADQNSADDGKRKMCPWQRMKWTDNMVRLLIMVVYYIGDEVGSEGNSNDPAGNKKKAGAGGVLQKKGKWKSVSRAMMERGFYVSPQQCEDKFNDLNKRYKRVNDIIGKGTACKVVENQTLLETLDLSPKMKEEAKKLLNSKHLFFREMCAYHNSCGHGGASGSTAVDGGSDPPSSQANNNHHHKCMHSSENVRIGPNLGRAEVEGPKVVKLGCGEEDNDDDADDDDEDSDDDEEYEEDEEDSRRQEEDDSIDQKSIKRARKTESWSPMMLQQLSGELTNVCQDSTRSQVEKRQWIKARTMQLEVQQVEYQSQALELEKQRLKWEKFSSKKEREMEREKMMNQRKKLENDRMVLLLHQKELELNDVHHQAAYNRTSDPSSVTG